MTYPSPRPEDQASETAGSADIPVPPEQLPPRVRVRLPRRVPFVVYALLGLSILVYLIQVATSSGLLNLGLRCPYFFSPDLPVCYGLKANALIRSGQWWRLLAPVLLHGSLLHIGFNMYALYILGPELENLFDHWAFLALYLASGFAGFVVSFLLTPANSLGASTAIFGLLAAQGVFVYRNQRIFGRRAAIILRNIINIALINFLIGLSPLIDNWGHLGGFLGGGLFALIASPDYHIAGEGPEFSLADQNPPGRVLLATVVTVALFASLALLKR